MKVCEEKKKIQRDRLGNKGWRTHKLSCTISHISMLVSYNNLCMLDS